MNWLGEFIPPATITRLVFIFGITNLVAVLVIFFTCRCIPMWKLTHGIMKQKWYQSFYKFHCYLWWILFGSIVIHIILAFSLVGFPF